MTPDRWQRAKALLDEALDHPPGERTAFLRDTCPHDAALRKEVQSLLASYDENESFFTEGADQQAILSTEDGPGDETNVTKNVGRTVGPYRLTEVLGRGSMGAVYRAVRSDEQYEREVALKVIHPGLHSEALAARFRAERQILATLEHPHIARLYDGGLTDDGRPYFAMERVEGLPIDRHCRANELGVDARVALFEQVAEAVAHAHRRLVVHRDLKPSNILVDGTGAPKLLDFGIAKLLEARTDDETAPPVTRTGQHLMTPEYAAPEQVRGEAVTPATDVYALGVLLYELLTGRRPYHFEKRTPGHIERVICKAQPERPSTAASMAASTTTRDHVSDENEGGSAPSSSRHTRSGRPLKGDLDRMVLKALRKEPDRRYATAAELAEDLRRHREGLPVKARPATLRYRTSKFLRRNRWGVGAAAVLALLLAAYAATVTVQARRLADERDRAQAQTERARTETEKAAQVTDYLVRLFESSDPTRTSKAQTVTARELLARGVRRAEDDLDDQPEVQAALYQAMGRAYRGLGRRDSAGVLLKRALALRRTIPGDHRREQAASLEALAELRLSQDRRADADSLYRTALSLRRALPDRAALAVTLARRARALGSLNRPNEAETLFYEALALSKEVHDAESPETANLLWDMSFYIDKSKGEKEATALLRKAVSIMRRQPDAPSLTLAEMLEDLGVRVMPPRSQRTGPIDDLEGIQLFREALDIKRGLLGPDALSTVRTLGTLAIYRGDIEQRIAASRREIRLKEEQFGSNHPRLVVPLSHLANAFRQQGRLDSALSAQRRALRIHRRTTSDTNQPLIAQLATVGDLIRADERPRDACPFYREALDLTLRLKRDSDVVVNSGAVGHAHARWGTCLAARGAYNEATYVFEEALALLAEGHPAYARTSRPLALTQLAALYEAQGHLARAAAWRDSLGADAALAAN
jgi:serine/threonine-protein kinase